MKTLGFSGAWFYRGAKIPMAHWIYHGAELPVCGRLRPRKDGFVWRHPTHDRHVPKCKVCQELIQKKRSDKAAASSDE